MLRIKSSIYLTGQANTNRSTLRLSTGDRNSKFKIQNGQNNRDQAIKCFGYWNLGF